MQEFLEKQGSLVLEIAVSCGSRPDLGRAKEKSVQNKESFMRCIEESKSTIRSGAVNDLKEVDTYYLPLNLLIFVLFVNDKIDDSEKLHKNGQLGQKSCSGACGNEDAYQLPHNLLQCSLWSTCVSFLRHRDEFECSPYAEEFFFVFHGILSWLCRKG